MTRDELRWRLSEVGKRCLDAAKTNDVEKIGGALVGLHAVVELALEHFETELERPR